MEAEAGVSRGEPKENAERDLLVVVGDRVQNKSRRRAAVKKKGLRSKESW
jgi:hypothetical protein